MFLDRDVLRLQAEAMPTPPTLKRRVLATELKALRHAARTTHTDVASRLGWNQAKVSKIESARQDVPVETVMALAELYGAAHEQRQRLIDLARAARTRPWWDSYSDVLPDDRRTYVGLETDAESVWSFAVEVIPELLQTRDYAEAVLLARDPGVSLPERKLELLVERQRGALEAPTVLSAVITESTLYRSVGGSEVLREQLRYLARLAEDAYVTIRVLPACAGALPVEEPFTLLRFGGGSHPDLAFLPRQLGSSMVEVPEMVEAYRTSKHRLESLSYSPEESLRLVVAVADEMAVEGTG